MANLEIDISKTFNFINENEVFCLQDDVSSVHKALIEGTGKGNDYLGWMKLPSQTDERLISRIEEEALRIKDVADILIVIGIGGSYLGARAVIEALNHHLNSLLQNRKAPLKVLPHRMQIGSEVNSCRENSFVFFPFTLTIKLLPPLCKIIQGGQITSQNFNSFPFMV